MSRPSQHASLCSPEAGGEMLSSHRSLGRGGELDCYSNSLFQIEHRSGIDSDREPAAAQLSVHTGCPKKNARLRLEAYNSSLGAANGTCRTIFGFLRFSAFI